MNKEKILSIDDLTLYHALLELDLIEEEKLDQLIQLQQKYSDKKLGEFLFDQDCIKEEWVERIVEHTKNTSRLEGSGSGIRGELPLVEDPTRLVGRKIGKYEIVRLLARGGMGFVYEGIDSILERRVAIKLLAPALSKNMEYRQRFIREAKLLAKIDHPHVVGVYDFGEAESTLFLASQYVEGKTLEEIAQTQKLGWEETFRYLRDVIAGLSEAHKLGMVHRDIKPANVLVDASGRGILTDFGIAYVDQSDLTQSGKSLGTPLYMAPEILEGKAVDIRCDIYSLGVSAYFLLSGENPFASDTPYEIIHRQLQGEYLPLEQVVELPPEIYNFINLLMKRNPDERPQNLEEVRIALEEAERKTLKKEGVVGRLKKESLSWLKKISGILPRDFSPSKLGGTNLKYYLAGGAVVALLITLGLALPWGKGASSSSSSRKPSSQKSQILKDLMERVDSLAEQGRVEGAMEVLEQSRRSFSADLQKDLEEKYQQMESYRKGWIVRFQEADKKGKASLAKGRTSLARRIYRPFQKLDIPQIQANLKSRLMALRKIDHKKIDQLTQEALSLLKEEKLRDALFLYDSYLAELPRSMRKNWEKSYRTFFDQVMEKVDTVLFQRDYSIILEWYNLLQNVPLKDLAERANRYFEKFKERLKNNIEAFVMRYQLSAKEEEKGNFKEAINLLEQDSIQPSPFQKIALARIRSLRTIASELPEGTRRVYGIYEAYIGKILLSGNSYFISSKDREKFLTSFDVGDPLCLLIRDQKAIKIEKNPMALHLEKAKKWSPRVLLTCTLKNREIIGLYYSHSPSELLIGEHQGSLFPKIERISWSQVRKIQKN